MTYLIIIIKSEVSALCAWLYPHMLSVSYMYPQKAGFFFYYCAFSCCVQIIDYIKAGWSHSFVCASHYLIIIIGQPYMKALKMLVRCILSRVLLRLSQFSQLSFIQYMGLCVHSLSICLMIIVNVCTIILLS